MRIWAELSQMQAKTSRDADADAARVRALTTNPDEINADMLAFFSDSGAKRNQ